MAEFFIPKTQTARLPDGSPHVLVRGIREVPHDLANHVSGNDYGIKPVSEMTDAERAEFGLPPHPEPVEREPAAPVEKAQDPATAALVHGINKPDAPKP